MEPQSLGYIIQGNEKGVGVGAGGGVTVAGPNQLRWKLDRTNTLAIQINMTMI